MTTKEQSLERLIERVKAATGPDRELDCRIAYELDFEVEGMAAPFRSYCDVHDLKWGDIARHANSPQSILSHNLPRFTASIDAALALVERLLPGWNYTFSRGHCELRHPKHRAKDVQAFGKTTPLAILAALLSSLKETSNDHE